jgi:hypothetical protein
VAVFAFRDFARHNADRRLPRTDAAGTLPGFLLTMVCIPAAFRTAISIRHSVQLGERLTILAKAREFGFSFLIVMWIELMACFAGITISSLIYVTLMLLFDANIALSMALIPGTVVGLAALLGLMWELRPGMP